MPRHVMAAALALMLLMTVSATAQWLNHPTHGIPRLPDGKPDLTAPVPRTATGSPDLSGIWGGECTVGSDCWPTSLFFDLAKDLPLSAVEMTPWAKSIQAQRQSRGNVDDPAGYCLPPGVPRITFANPFKIVQTPGVTIFLHEDVTLMFRQIFTDGRGFPEVTERTWLGYSVGKWEDDVFVVRSTGFRDGGYLDTRRTRPASDALVLTERYHRRDFGHLELELTVDDTKAYLKPWTVKTTLILRPDTELLEAFCDAHAKTMEHRVITLPPPEPPSPPLPRSTGPK